MNKLCIDCKHKVVWRGLRKFINCDACESPEIPVDFVNGKKKMEYCSVARRFSEMCGPSAKWFELKEKK